MPDGAEYLWEWFCALSQKRQFGMGPNPISEEAIGWFFRNRRLRAQDWELRTLTRLDQAWLTAQAKDKPKEGKGK
jgi:hypothetical protein